MAFVVAWDGSPASGATVSNLNDSGAGSLRDAITTANLAGSAQSIDFNITGGGTITLGSMCTGSA